MAEAIRIAQAFIARRFSERREVMKLNTMRLMIALLAVAITFTITSAQNSSELAGTSWQLVKFQAPDETTYAPDDKSKYTITFGRNGRVTARVDCNRASSSWKSTRAGELQFGSWSRTSVKCGPGSLHDRIVTEGANVRSYVIKNGHLFLSGMAAGGSYELEPLTTRKR